MLIFRQTNHAVIGKITFHSTVGSSQSPGKILDMEIERDSYFCFQLAQVQLSGRLWSQADYGLQSRDQNPEEEWASDSGSLCRIWAGAVIFSHVPCQGGMLLDIA